MLSLTLLSQPPPAGDPLAAAGASPLRWTALFLGVGALMVFALLKHLQSLRAEDRYRRQAAPKLPPRLTVAAGWYPTPDDLSERYHDGARWTEEFRPLHPRETAPEEPPVAPDTR